MKKQIILLSILIIPFITFSQDIITKVNGEKIYCEITNEDSVKVYFNIYRNGIEISTFLDRSNIKSIKYESKQYDEIKSDFVIDESNKKSCITVGILQGGGSLFGFDFETLLYNRIGVQVGAGLVGFGGGINYHLKPAIRSSFLSCSYWHQGIGESFAQSIIGPTFVYRGKKWFTAQLGFGFPLDIGPALEETDFEQPPVMLIYSIGAYIPF
jgi:hypothetical protein